MKIKKHILLAGLCAAGITAITSCSKSSFDELYRDPGKISEVSADKQFAGITYSYRELVVPSYWNYFVILRSTANRYVQATGWANENNQLIPGGASTQDRWNTYYAGLAQYREFEKVYTALPEAERTQLRIFYLAAKIFFYDQTQQVVDLHGDIPWSQAGMLSTNGGNYPSSYAKYDTAEEIYKAMLDDLKAISTELNTLPALTSGVSTSFKTQDLINKGDITLWKKYCNSLRLRMLTRVSAASTFTARANQELADIIGNQSTYPLTLTNADNIDISVFNSGSDINARGFRDGLESWNANIAGKVMIDNMVSKADPRLPFIFEPGQGANGAYIGLDQSLTSAEQTALISGTPANPSKIAIYNRSTYSRNEYFPGLLITASEVNYLLAEYYNRTGNNAAAKSAFEQGVKQSIALFPAIRALSKDNTTTAAAQPTDAQINTYISNIGWGTNNIQLIATQKWLHFNVIQPLQSWAEVRRLNYPVFTFRTEVSDIQKTVPTRWNIPATEVNLNGTNYDAVKSKDKLDTKIFWDVN
ncbi:SusD/RagB family nutrient-binding outer membrane lipoprotein [Sphingobacterium sp.]|uniref:SusD/RagB family nutrient-binding outer membrane lipoprotein n=1 Tax=Sphingobacterium sp. TaxID=341027 RepID=UPI002584CC9B|nr:SusD/RagB family nutrient-binding outer membrane lipoprotein [Sphingobacterium sp.]WET70297.1 MAG: SusD/RagB family nutrient-binding outer membrane lipoprotein [Sphingobacterium sp.]